MAQRIDSLRSRLARRLPDPREERGSILLEALASAVVLAIATLAVMSAVDGATSASARSKGRSVAAALAEQDQERMRAMRFVDLSTYNVESTQSVDGSTYTVKSRAEWMRDATGATQSCTNESSQADYIRISSTVTSDVVGTATKPVVLESLVSPTVASFGPDEGTLAVKLIDRNDNPLPNVNVSIDGERDLSDVTNSAGCAVFAHIPDGDYDIVLNQPGWVTAKSVNRGSVIAGEVVVTDVRYDRAAQIRAGFVTRAPGVPDQPSSAWTLSAANAALPGTPVMQSVAPGPAGTIAMTDLFPYKTGYSFYTGNCEANAPTTTNPAYYTGGGPGFEELDSGEIVGANPAPPMTVVQPGIRMQVVSGTTPLAGARIVATSTSSGCATKYVLTTTSAGWLSSSASTYDPGLPFGTYSLCVQGPGNIRRTDITVDNTSAAGVSVTPPVNMAGAPGGTCT
jgi:Tfp pilus assembly protein PilV